MKKQILVVLSLAVMGAAQMSFADCYITPMNNSAQYLVCNTISHRRALADAAKDWTTAYKLAVDKCKSLCSDESAKIVDSKNNEGAATPSGEFSKVCPVHQSRDL